MKPLIILFPKRSCAAWIALSACLFASPAFANPEKVIVTETRVDVTNLFGDGQQKSAGDQNAPRGAPSLYRLRTTYQIPYGQEAEAKIVHVPDGIDCGEMGSCLHHDEHLEGSLSFTNPLRGQVRWELIEEKSGRVVDVKSELLQFTPTLQRNDVPMGAEVRFEGITEMTVPVRVGPSASPPGLLGVEFSLAQGDNRRLYFSGAMNENLFRDGKMKVENLGNNRYRLADFTVAAPKFDVGAFLSPVNLRHDSSTTAYVGGPGKSGPFSDLSVKVEESAE